MYIKDKIKRNFFIDLTTIKLVKYVASHRVYADL